MSMQYKTKSGFLLSRITVNKMCVCFTKCLFYIQENIKVYKKGLKKNKICKPPFTMFK